MRSSSASRSNDRVLVVAVINYDRVGAFNAFQRLGRRLQRRRSCAIVSQEPTATAGRETHNDCALRKHGASERQQRPSPAPPEASRQSGPLLIPP